MSSPTTSTSFKGVVGFLVVMELGSGILQGWYPVLLNAIGSEFGTGAAQLNWVSAAYMLATVVCVPVIAKLGDRFGHKRVLAIAASFVALGSIIVAIAPSYAALLVGRAIQGPLAAFLPLEFAIVRDRDEKSSGRSIGKLTGALTFGAAIGSLAAGLLYQATGSLRGVLWGPAIFLVICVPVVIFLVPESKARTTGRIDWTGAALLGIGLLLTLAGISNAATWGWTSALTWSTIIGGLILLAGWVLSAQKVKHPLIDLRILVGGGIGLPVLTAFLFGAQMLGAQTASTVFLLTDPSAAGFGLGVSSGAVGLIALGTSLCAFIAASTGDRFATRLGATPTLMLGGALIVVNYVGFILAPGSLALFLAVMMLGGLGNGLVISVLPTIVVRRAPADSVGISSAMYNTARTAAGAVAGAAFALVMSSFLFTYGTGEAAVTTTSRTGYLAVWGICAAIGVALIVCSYLIRAGVPAPAADPIPTPETTDLALEGEQA